MSTEPADGGIWASGSRSENGWRGNSGFWMLDPSCLMLDGIRVRGFALTPGPSPRGRGEREWAGSLGRWDGADCFQGPRAAWLLTGRPVGAAGIESRRDSATWAILSGRIACRNGAARMGGMRIRSSWQFVAAIAFLLLGLLFTGGAANAHRASVGTPHHAGILGLSILPSAAFLVGFVFLAWAVMRAKKQP
jgi:hypothetical protein